MVGRRQQKSVAALAAALVLMASADPVGASWIWWGSSGETNANLPADGNAPLAGTPTINSEPAIDEFHLMTASSTSSASESITEPTNAVDVPVAAVAEVEEKAEAAAEAAGVEVEEKTEAVEVEVITEEKVEASVEAAIEPEVTAVEPAVAAEVTPTAAVEEPAVATGRSWSLWNVFFGGASEATEEKSTLAVVGGASEATEEKPTLAADDFAIVDRPERKVEEVPDVEELATVEEAAEKAVEEPKELQGPKEDKKKAPLANTFRSRTLRRQAKKPVRHIVKATTPPVDLKGSRMVALPKLATLTHLAGMLDRLAEDKDRSKYVISGITAAWRARDLVKQMVENAYGMVLLESNRRSIVVGRRGYGRRLVTKAFAEELIREESALNEAALKARVGPVVESISSSSSSEKEEFGEDLPPAAELKRASPPKNHPHSEKNLHRTKWTKPPRAAKKPAMRKDAWMEDLEPAAHSESEEIDYDDPTIDWEHFIEADDGAVVEEAEPAPMITKRQAPAPPKRVHKTEQSKKELTPAEFVKATQPKSEHVHRKATEKEAKAKRKERLAQKGERPSYKQEVRRATQDWRALLKECFDPSISFNSSYSADYSAEYSENISSSASEEEKPFNLAGFFAKDYDAKAPEDHPWNMHKLFEQEAEPEEEVPIDMEALFPSPAPSVYPSTRRSNRHLPGAGRGANRLKHLDKGVNQRMRMAKEQRSSGRGRGNIRLRNEEIEQQTVQPRQATTSALAKKKKWVRKPDTQTTSVLAEKKKQITETK